MSNNVSPDLGSIDAVVISRSAEMETYDAMPRRFRVLVDSLPILQRVAKIQEYRDALGDDEAYRRIVALFSAQFPGWVPPTD